MKRSLLCVFTFIAVASGITESHAQDVVLLSEPQAQTACRELWLELRSLNVDTQAPLNGRLASVAPDQTVEFEVRCTRGHIHVSRRGGPARSFIATRADRDLAIVRAAEYIRASLLQLERDDDATDATHSTEANVANDAPEATDVEDAVSADAADVDLPREATEDEAREEGARTTQADESAASASGALSAPVPHRRGRLYLAAGALLSVGRVPLRNYARATGELGFRFPQGHRLAVFATVQLHTRDELDAFRFRADRFAFRGAVQVTPADALLALSALGSLGAARLQVEGTNPLLGTRQRAVAWALAASGGIELAVRIQRFGVALHLEVLWLAPPPTVVVTGEAYPVSLQGLVGLNMEILL